MPLPLPKRLMLKEADDYVAERCRISVDEAKAGLMRAFRESVLAPHGILAPHGNDDLKISADWSAVEIDWDANLITERTSFNKSTWQRVYIHRQHIDLWLGIPSIIKRAPASVQHDQKKKAMTVFNVEKVVARYISAETSYGREPTQDGCVKNAEEEYRGGRELVKDEYKKQMTALGKQVIAGKPKKRQDSVR